tara:strand:- start:477 stop:698 length:222 start_codon:yes stop_codon:yes gene_type:complete
MNGTTPANRLATVREFLSHGTRHGQLTAHRCLFDWIGTNVLTSFDEFSDLLELVEAAAVDTSNEPHADAWMRS